MIAADNGVRLTYLDPLAKWVPDWQPSGVNEDVLAYFNRTPDEFFRIAEALRVDKVHLIGTFPEGRYATDFLVERYAAICDRAAEHGLRCTIEAIPMFGLKTIDSVWKIVVGANRPNGGIVFDTWHYIRGGRNDALLRSIPHGMIDSVQLADGTLELPAGRSMIEDCLLSEASRRRRNADFRNCQHS
jgi:4-hydroxyphenylpyruvate dioxygenase